MLNVFIVDDDRRFIDSLSELLGEHSDIRVAGHAETEDAAVEWLIGNRAEWDLGIVDLALGAGSGLRVLSACRVRQAGQKIVVLSNHLNSAMRRRCTLLGADAAFAKDADIEAILRYCRDVCASNR